MMPHMEDGVVVNDLEPLEVAGFGPTDAQVALIAAVIRLREFKTNDETVLAHATAYLNWLREEEQD